ncbi:hypothetical protein [Falsiroseomonas sp. E2-1-a20]|uniref:hypothetical protein n=1 Tax=Falsiroseomonas sp. E2-1-a20 TaxID=3239300 RepID=UPI003F345072
MPILVGAAAVKADATLFVLQPSITRWQRLEVSPAALDMAPGLDARIADPLWMIGRQWQFAELLGNDAGSPVSATLAWQSAPLRVAGGDAEIGSAPVEPIIEAEPARAAYSALAAEAGIDFGRALALEGAAALLPVFRAAFPFRPPEPDALAARDMAGQRFRALATGALDGAALAAALAAADQAAGAAALPDAVAVPEQSRDATLRAATAWLGHWRSLLLEPDGASAWNAERLAYRFTLEAVEPDGRVTPLPAEGYADGRLDWWSFDQAASAGGGAAAGAHSVTRMPAPVTFAGMPADRYWEMELGGAPLAGVSAGPAGIATMLALEFLLVSGTDWFQLPLRLPYGVACRVSGLSVTDCFGVAQQIGRAAPGPGGWAVFDPSVQDRTAEPLFLLPSVTAGVLEGEPIEEVALFRDEAANLAWAVERRVPGLTSVPLDGKALAAPEGALLWQRPEGEAELAAAAIYRLQSPVPLRWFPLVPERDPDRVGGVKLRLRRLRRATATAADESGPDAQRALQLQVNEETPLATVLRPQDGAFVLAEQEVPRAGLVLTRSFQYTRGPDGARLLWLGRRKRIGHGEGASGLAFDLLDPVRQTA